MTSLGTRRQLKTETAEDGDVRMTGDNAVQHWMDTRNGDHGTQARMTALAEDSDDETTTSRPSLSRHRSATVRVTGDDAGELASRLQRQADEDEEGETTARRPSLARHRSATIRVTGDDAGELSSRLQERRRSVVGAGL